MTFEEWWGTIESQDILEVANMAWDAATEQGRKEMLDRIRAVLKEYPVAGLDIEIGQAIDRIVELAKQEMRELRKK